MTATLNLLENQKFRLIPSTLLVKADISKNLTWCEFEFNQDFILHEIDILHRTKYYSYEKGLSKFVTIGPSPTGPPAKNMSDVLINEEILLPELPYWSGYLYDSNDLYVRTNLQFDVLLKNHLTIRGRNEYFYNDIKGIIKIFLIQYL